ncbi:hypothetical protein E2C01_100974 [Portunus trituberculatus]|uniref:Uncharacterized protein n=1 Tax=Portunus trituberculatus TaxID=210409 RepID=A0A5B7K9F2_PORTR|nr:hypothetical protein [Portunus trituberculatus]
MSVTRSSSSTDTHWQVMKHQLKPPLTAALHVTTLRDRFITPTNSLLAASPRLTPPAYQGNDGS